MRTPSIRPSCASSSTFACVASKTSGSSMPHARELADVEEAAVEARAPVEVEELRPQSRVAPERVLVPAAMWFGTMSSMTPNPDGAELAELLLAAELLRDARRVDDVVAVRRARARLQRRREVEVRDAEVAQVRHELPRLARIRSPASAGAGRWLAAASNSADPAENDERAPSTGTTTARGDGRQSPLHASARPSRARAPSGGRTRRPEA